jgi:hypothetical protein
MKTPLKTPAEYDAEDFSNRGVKIMSANYTLLHCWNVPMAYSTYLGLREQCAQTKQFPIPQEKIGRVANTGANYIAGRLHNANRRVWSWWRAFKPLPVFVCCALIVSGCAHYQINAPLTAAKPAAGYRFENAVALTNSDDLMLLLAFSGGGTRAAALSYAVLDELAKTEVGPPSHEHRLLDDINMISAVSGGSITAAYYTQWGDRIFSDYESQFLKGHAQNGLLLRLVEPWNLVRLLSPRYCSSDLAEGY